VNDGKSNLRRRSLTDRSRHSSFHFISLGFSLKRRKKGRKEERKKGRKKRRSVIPARSLQLLVGNLFPILRIIPNVFSASPVTLLYPEEMFKIPALQVMNKCSLF
jgi:hypothetical protein